MNLPKSADVSLGCFEHGVTVLRDGRVVSRPDLLAEEVPVALVFNGISHAVMLASPLDLEDFALGFALTEGLIESAHELYSVDVVQPNTPTGAGGDIENLGIELHLEVAAACEWRLKERRRTLAGRTGCGLCGIESLKELKRVIPKVPKLSIKTEALLRAQKMLQPLQRLQQNTGATHAAAWCALDGNVLILREDVGRHNALDKLVGRMVKDFVESTKGFVMITSRASFEMVQKTAMAGVGILAAVSAPTALAVNMATACGLALAGFVRGDNFVAYTFPDQFGLGAKKG